MYRFRSVLFLALAGMSGLNALDDLRLCYTRGNEEFTFTPPVGASGGDRSWDSNTRWEVLLMGVEGMNMFGLSFVKRDAEYDGDGFTLDYGALGGRLYLGQSLPLADSLALELMGFAGWSRTEAKYRDAAGPLSDKNWMWEYGLEADLLWCFGRNQGLILGGGGGYSFVKEDFELAGARGLNQQGWSLKFTVGWRWNN